MKNKKYWFEATFLAFILLTVLFLVVLAVNADLKIENKQLKQELSETQEQLLISNDQLKQINMRNEAIYYINELNRQNDDVDE